MIVIEPANPQVVYVPQYNPEVVYTQPASTTVVIQEEDDDDYAEAVAAGMIGFTAGVAIGAAVNNNYYYGGVRLSRRLLHAQRRVGGQTTTTTARMPATTGRTTGRSIYEDRGDVARETQEQRTERAQDTTEQRTERTQTRQENPQTQAQREQRRTDAQAKAGEAARSTGATSQEARGFSGDGAQTRERSGDRSGTKSDAFSGYWSGKSERAASSRGEQSRSSSGGSRGGGGGLRGGGGGRRGPTPMTSPRARAIVLACLCAALAPALSCTSSTPKEPTFSTPEDAVRKLGAAVKDKNPEAVLAIFGPDGKDLVDVSDPTAARLRRQVFKVALAEGWRLEDGGADRRTLVIGNEAWPFPVPLVKGAEQLGDSTRPRGRKKCSRVGSDATSWPRSWSAGPMSARSAATRARPRWQAGRRLCEDPGQRSGPPERALLAGRSRPAAQSAGRPGGAGGGGTPRDGSRRPAAVAPPTGTASGS